MEPFRVVVDRKPAQFEKEEKHLIWKILEQSVIIDNTHQSVSNAIKIYTHSVFEAINDGDPFKIKFYDFDFACNTDIMI